jgi:uncharacterized protein YbcI
VQVDHCDYERIPQAPSQQSSRLEGLAGVIETARPVMETTIREITGVDVVSLHHDISTLTGEEVVLFTLAESPCFRETKKK